MKYFILILVLAGCDGGCKHPQIDEVAQMDLYKACIANVINSPYNCEQSARRMATKCTNDKL